MCVGLYLAAYISFSTVPVQSITKHTYITGLVIFSPVTMATCDVTAVCSMRLSGYQLTTERLLGPVGWMPRSTAAVTGGGLSMNTNFRTNSSLHRSISSGAAWPALSVGLRDLEIDSRSLNVIGTRSRSLDHGTR